MRGTRHWLIAGVPALVLGTPAAHAQHTADDAVTSAEDAFGTAVGHEQIGLYNDGNVRGFSPATAANIRIEGLYFDAEAGIGDRVIDGETIRVGLGAQGYAFPAPTGIADLTLRGSGDRLALSPILSADSYGSRSLEMDGQAPLIAGTLSTAIGVGAYHDVYDYGGDGRRWNIGIVPRWHPARGVEVIGFYSREQTYGATAQPVYLPTGDFLPARVRRAHFPGPQFTRTDGVAQTFGAIVRATLGEWTLRAGVFRSLNATGLTWSDNIVVNPDMRTDRQIAAFPASASGSWSGELRASRRIAEGRRQHLVTVSLRARDILSQYGGGASADLGPAALDQAIAPPQPALALGPLTQDRTHQATLGLAYGLRWQGWGAITLGMQRTRYIKAVDQPGLPFAHRVNAVWLPSVGVSAPLSPALAVYGSFVRGLEDAGAAPAFAANPGQLIPAIRTRQIDAGLRWKAGKRTTLIVGWYDIAKPYINLDHAAVYRGLGRETHTGIEASLTASPFKGLTVVAGGMFARPRVRADATLGQPVGALPVGQYATSTRLDVDYVLPFAPRVTLDGYVHGDGRAAGTVDNRVILPATARVGLGARWRFALAGRALSLRVVGNNLTNVFGWEAEGSGAYQFRGPRNVRFYLAADF